MQKKKALFPNYSIAEIKPLFSRIPYKDEPELAHKIIRGEKISQKKFSFLNIEKIYSRKIHWNDPNVSQLWRYNLHYFNYVLELIIWGKCTGNDDNAWKAFVSIANSWIDENMVITGDGWHPYTISLRIVNWIHALTHWKTYLSTDPNFSDRIYRSLYGQVKILASYLEKDVRGNHLLKNVKALIWAGKVFNGKEPERWFLTGLNILHRELAEQIFQDGGHFERSPGYHLDVLRDILEISIWLKRNNNRNVPPWLEKKLKSMLDFLCGILPPSNVLPMLKDTSLDGFADPEDILTAGALYFNSNDYLTSKRLGLYPSMLFGESRLNRYDYSENHPSKKKSRYFGDSGFCVFRDDSQKDFLILDAGSPCPDYLPAHAHADMLSYELTANGHQIIVDSGVYEYTAGKWRDYFRSTRAHNTVEIDGQNQSDVWSSFRVGNRAEIGPVSWNESDKYIFFRAEHDGYTRRPSRSIHCRTVVWVKGKFWIILDEIFGKRPVSAINYIHFAPEVSLCFDEKNNWRIHAGENPLWLSAFGYQNSKITKGSKQPSYQGWCSTKFGKLTPNNVLSLHTKACPYFCFGYGISKKHPLTIHFEKGGYEKSNIVVHCHQETYRIDIKAKEISKL
ncbi:MAG: alginate lyase family protein [Desulfobacterales bacterium]|nr:alginate lyase family protein [Desulfobacterales bacterium]